MKSTHGAGSIAIDRRQFLSAAMSGTTALVLGAAGFTVASRAAQDIQIGGTPPAPPIPEAPPPSGETVDDVAARLNYDTDAIFAFVRDQIHYESYAGVLRGARGTLWARAGNAADQAVLLGALLAAAQIPYRFAIGPLDPAQVEALTAGLTLTTDEASMALDEAKVAATLHTLGLTDVAELEAANGQDALDPYEETAQATLDLAQATLASSQASLTGALEGAAIALPPLEAPALADLERDQHAWVQVADGPAWLDYDPSLPEGAAATPVETPDALPDDWRHALKIAIAADDFTFGALSRREVVAYSTTSDQLVDIPVAISMAAPEDLASLGLGLTELFTGQKSIFPTIYADGVSVDAAAPLVFATGEVTTQDPFGGTAAGVAEGETLAVWLVVEIASPGAGPVTIERALLDRVPAEDRASGLVVPETVTPVTMITTILGEVTLAELNVLPIIHVDVARLPAINAVDTATRDGVFSSLGLLGPTLASFRDKLGQQDEARNGTWSYPSAPNVTVFHIAPPAADQPNGATTVAADLLHRHRTSLPLADTEVSTAVHPLVLSGVLDAVAEATLLRTLTGGETPDDATVATGPTVGDVFAAAAASNVDVAVLTSAADLGLIDADVRSQGYLTAALDTGLYVVVPQAPVDIGGEPVLGWWIVDPLTGRTRDQLQNGMASASAAVAVPAAYALQDLGEYSFVTRAVTWIFTNATRLACIAYGMTAGIFFAMAYIDAGSGGGAPLLETAAGVGAAGAASGVC